MISYFIKNHFISFFTLSPTPPTTIKPLTCLLAHFPILIDMRINTVAAPAPAPHHRESYSLGVPSPSPTTTFEESTSSLSTTSSATVLSSSPPPTNFPVDFSPPLIAMLVIIATALVFITYSRLISRRFLQLHRRYLRWRRRRRRYAPSSSAGNIGSPPYPFDPSTDSFQVFSPYGLDESVIKAIPLSVYTRKASVNDCAVCLLEFEESDYVRTLPSCSHAFHVDCIDIWLRSHANCPLCRSGIFRPESPFTPLMAARIRPSLEDVIIDSIILEPLTETLPENDVATIGEITQEQSPRMNIQSEDRYNGRDFLLKRSYSFSFERNIGSERLVMEAATASPWRYRRGSIGGSGSFWSKRPSPFSSLMKPRVFSFRYYRGMKSPFFRRRSGSFFPLSESSARFSSTGGGGSSRRSKFFASPMFMRSSTGPAGALFSSSRHRSGDPEALLSPDRYNRRWR